MVKLKMSGFESNIKEVIYLSDLIRNQDFRTCFIMHFTRKVKGLENISSKVDVKIGRRLQSKLLDPLLFHLKGTSNSDDKLMLIECITQVLKITLIHSVSDFFEVYTVIFFQIFEGGNLPYQPSEELIQSALECCTFLLRNSSESVLEKVYTQEYAAKFSIGISVSVGLVQEQRSVSLRATALNFLLASTKFNNWSNYSDNIFNQIGDLFMLYLPGILAPLLKVILREETQHHIITKKTLTCWGHVLCLVMRDSNQDERLSDREIIKQWLISQSNTENKLINVNKVLKEKKRTRLWFESAGMTLQPLLIKVADLRKHSNSKCRLELTVVMVQLLKNCLRNLRSSLPIIIEILISSTVDENSDVRQVAEEALYELETEYNKNNIDILVPIVEENLYTLINKLPAFVHAKNEQLLLLSLKSLSGYIKILGRHNRLHNLFSLSSTLRKLISALTIIFELEVHPEVSAQDFSICDNEVNCNFWCKQWKRFRHFNEQSISKHLEEIGRHLGSFGPCETILDFLLDHYNDNLSYRKEILLITNEVILGANDIKEHTVNQLLDFYLKPQNINISLQVNDSDCVSLREAQSNVIQVALVMEGIGKLAKRMGTKFQECLLKSLYYVLLQMGSSFPIIRDAASKSANEIAKACDSKCTVKALIQNNIDYLSYHLTVNLKRDDEGALDVITVLIKNTSLQAMPNLKEIINNVLRTSSRNFDSPYTLSYLRLFQTFVTNWTKCINAEACPTHVKTHSEVSGVDRLLKYLKKKKKKEYENEETEKNAEFHETSDCERVTENSKKPKLPSHLKIILAIANHCLHFLPTKDKCRKVIVLEILNECVWAMSGWEDDLLPLVHNIWSPLVTKFESTADPLILSRSFKLLCTLSLTTKDFVRARTLKNVLPTCEHFLIHQAMKSKQKDSASEYFFTQNFKLQRELLNHMGKLTWSLGLFEKQMDLLVESALPYINSFQPRELQESCKKFFQDITSYDSYLVWYKVHKLTKNSEFSKNAEMILRTTK